MQKSSLPKGVINVITGSGAVTGNALASNPKVGIVTPVNCRSFRATGITTYLTNGGRLEIAQRMAGHADAKTTGLYDRRSDDICLDEVERIVI